MRDKARNIELFAVAGFAVLLIVILPILNTHGIVPDFYIELWGKYLCYAILAISVDVLWGYTGLLSLGQALFFSLGGYMLGMHLMLKIGYLEKNHSDLPDFMVFLGHTFLPWCWKPFYSFGFAAFMVVFLPGTLALIFGYLAFRSRIKGVYFSILTQALTYAAALLFFSNDTLMGGNNGFTDFKTVLGYNIHSADTKRGLFIATSVLLVAVYLGCRWLTRTKFGLVQRAVRDSEVRVLFSGYAAANYKLFIFVAAAVVASLGGALYVPQAGIINPSEMWPDKSLEAVVWVAVGGRGTLVGPIIGAVAVNALKSWASREFADLWLILLGTLFILVVLFLPKGIISIPSIIGSWFKRQPKEEVTAPIAPKSEVNA